MSDAPLCEKCTYSRMIEVNRKPVVPKLPPGAGARYKHGGHPTLGMIATIAGAIGGVTNYFFEQIEYKCPTCDLVTNRTVTKK